MAYEQRDAYYKLKFRGLEETDPVRQLQYLDSGVRPDVRPFEFDSVQGVLEKSQFEFMHSDLNTKKRDAIDPFDSKLDYDIEKMIHQAKIEDVLNSNIYESLRFEDERRQLRSKALRERRQREIAQHEVERRAQREEIKNEMRGFTKIGSEQLESKFQKLKMFDSEVLTDKFSKYTLRADQTLTNGTSRFKNSNINEQSFQMRAKDLK